VTHRRAVLHAGDDLWIIVDDLLGSGTHDLRLHWLLADFPFYYNENEKCITLKMNGGDFSLSLHNVFPPAAITRLDLVRGSEKSAPRGWISNYYGVRHPALSFTNTYRGELPFRFVSVFSPDEYQRNLTFKNQSFIIHCNESLFKLSLQPVGSAEIIKSIYFKGPQSMNF
jgi:hypothetical protein